MSTSRKRVIGYVRVSTEEQKRHGNSMEIQADRIRNYCAAMNWELVGTVEEPAESGSSMEKRKKLMDVINRIKAGTFEADAIVSIKLDRIARNLKELLVLHDDILEPNGIGLVSLDDQFDTSTAQGRLFFQIIGGFAEFERKLITERTMGGITHRAREGKHASGRTPIGYKSIEVDGKKELQVDQSEAQVVQIIFHLRDSEEMTFRDIADYLNVKGYKPKNWKPDRPSQFHNSSIRLIYNNPKYKGIYTFNRRGEDVIVVQNESLRILPIGGR